jgi:hypothetical protein
MLLRQRFKTVSPTVELLNFVHHIRMHGARGFPESLKRKLKLG